MCLTTSPTHPIETILLNHQNYLIGWKDFSLTENQIYPQYIKTLYKISKSPTGFLRFAEQSEEEQLIETTCVNREGRHFEGTSVRCLKVGMHIFTECLPYHYLIPVLVSMNNIILFGSDSTATVAEFLVPTIEYASNNFALYWHQMNKLEELWDIYENQEKGK